MEAKDQTLTPLYSYGIWVAMSFQRPAEVLNERGVVCVWDNKFQDGEIVREYAQEYKAEHERKAEKVIFSKIFKMS